jgi:hypothetical protein
VPVSTRVDRAARIVRIELNGTLSTAEMLACIDDAAREIGTESGYRVLSDHSGLDAPATPDQIQAVVRHLGGIEAFSGLRWAVVVKLVASRGMMAQLSRFTPTINIEMGIFETVEDAERWLGPP